MKELWLCEAERSKQDGNYRYPSRFILEADYENLQIVLPLPKDLIRRAKRYYARQDSQRRGMITEPVDQETYAMGARFFHPLLGVEGTIISYNERGQVQFLADGDEVPNDLRSPDILQPISSPDNAAAEGDEFIDEIAEESTDIFAGYDPHEYDDPGDVVELDENDDYLDDDGVDEIEDDEDLTEADEQKKKEDILRVRKSADAIVRVIRSEALYQLNRSLVTVLPIPCGSGKSSAVSRLINDTIDAYENGSGKGLLIITTNKKQMKRYPCIRPTSEKRYSLGDMCVMVIT